MINAHHFRNRSVYVWIVVWGLLPGGEADLETLAAAGDMKLFGPEKPKVGCHCEGVGVLFIWLYMQTHIQYIVRETGVVVNRQIVYKS